MSNELADYFEKFKKPAAPARKELVVLTTLERNALLQILIAYVRVPDHTEIWEDVITEQKVTLDDLLSLLAEGR